MRIVFAINADSEAYMTPETEKALADLPAIIAADYLQDVLFDTIAAYNAARTRLGWASVGFPTAGNA